MASVRRYTAAPCVVPCFTGGGSNYSEQSVYVWVVFVDSSALKTWITILFKLSLDLLVLLKILLAYGVVDRKGTKTVFDTGFTLDSWA